MPSHHQNLEFILPVMQSYELLVVFPGTLAETEVGTLADAVKKQVEDIGATDVSMSDLGKSRLAYPMRHIRYGYFRMYRFAAEPTKVPVMQSKILLISQVLRAFVQKFDPSKQAQPLNRIMSDAAIAAEAEESKKAPVVEETAAPEVVEFQTVAKATTPKSTKKEEEKVASTTEAINLDDIDKKLDELLESDLTKV
jgi:ribosomal protein S6